MRRNVCLQIPDHFALATGNDLGQSRFGSPCSGCLLLSHRQSCLPLSCVHHVVDHQLCYSTGNHACATVCSRFLRYKSRFPSVQHFSGEVLQTHSACATKVTACIITRLTLYHCPRMALIWPPTTFGPHIPYQLALRNLDYELAMGDPYWGLDPYVDRCCDLCDAWQEIVRHRPSQILLPTHTIHSQT
jgi:hypothetical protein